MITFFTFLIILVVIYLGITWLLPQCIGYVLKRKFNIKIRFGRIGLPFSLRDVNICKSGFSVQIDEICIRSSFFNSEVTKLLSINIRDIRINKDVNRRQQQGGASHSQNNQQNAGAFSDAPPNGKGSSGRKTLDFREKKVHPMIIKFAQFMAVHINNVSIALLNSDHDPGWLLHATAKELHLDGSIVHNTKTMLVSAALCDAQAKILRHCPATKKKLGDNQACLGELSFGIAMDSVLVAHGPISLEKLHLAMTNTKVVLHGGLYEFIKDAQNQKRRQQMFLQQNSVNLGWAELDEGCQDGSGMYLRIAPIIPKNFVIKIEGTTISAVRENSSNDFSATLQSFTVSGKFNNRNLSDEFRLPMFYIGTQLQQLEIDTLQEKLLYMEQFSIDAKLEKDLVNVYSKLKSFRMIYHHREIYGWISKNFFSSERLARQMNPKSLKLATSMKSSRFAGANGGALEHFLKRVVITGCAELWNVTSVFKFGPQEVSSIYCNHTKLLLDQLTPQRSSVYQNRLLKMILGNRHWSAELMIESLWWSLNGNVSNNKEFGQSLKKSHIRRSPFYIGVSLIKLSSYGDATKLDLSIHTFRTEYSPALAAYLIQAKQCLEQYRSTKIVSGRKASYCSTVEEEDPGILKKPPSPALLITAKVTDVTSFFFNKYETCVLANLNEISLAKTPNVNVLNLDHFHMETLDFKNITGSEFGPAEMQNMFANFKLIRIEYTEPQHHPKHLAIHFLEDTGAMWNANLHMHIVALFSEIRELRAALKPKEIAQPPLELPTKETPKSTDSEKHPWVIDVYAEGNAEFAIKISERHSMQIFSENLYISRKEYWFISFEHIFIKIDDQHIFSFNDVDCHQLGEMDVLRAERKHYENFRLANNKVWATTIGVVRIIFPYDHDFYGAIVNEFVSIYKWLKVVHGYKKKPFTIDSPLPSDMFIQIKEFLMEMSDDPFEVKLRDNYVLLLDEYNESVKRKELFDQKIEQLFSERLLLPAGTLEELNANLIKKNSEIYIQRSKKLAETGPPRTRLIAWIMTDLEIMAMADPYVHGTDNAVRMIREIDAESPWPEEGIEFVTLWCRAVNVSCTEWKFMLRDYPQPMFHVKAMHLFGYLAGAEMAPPRRAKRDVDIEIGDPFGTHTIQRSMTSIKFYHDFDWELDYLAYAFGPCWEPVMAQCNLMMEKISAPSRDPSPPLPFWDKMRLLMHGRLTIIAKQFTILLHASLDPYNTTEEMELTWSNCGIVYTNAKIMFKGDLNVFVRTASRYDDCRLLHLPNLKLTFKLSWICLANPNDHHAVIPCAPDKLPEYSSNQVHDSFRAFRSQNLNIWVSFEIKQNVSELDVPNLELYGSTLRWFESLKLILSGVTRPTRRGPVFNNVRPRKKQLSRHYRKANLQMSLHKFQIFYWMSHALNRGFQLNGGRISFSSEHTLSLSPIDDGLIHRPRADWAIMYMNCELNDAEIWLRTTTISDRTDGSSESFSNSNGDIYRYYFLSVARVSYGREAHFVNGSEREKDTPTHKLVVYDLKGAWTKDNRDVAFALFDSFMKSQRLKNNLSTEALKCFRKESNNTPFKSRNSQDKGTSSAHHPEAGGGSRSGQGGHISKRQETSDGLVMLQQLIAESDHKSVVFSDDLSAQTRQQQLKGLQACQDDDVLHYNWFISLVNSQVLLKGCETSGYVILSAAKAEILQRVHRPVWRDHTIVSKTTWVGSLECMQYYATVSEEDGDTREMAEIMWLTVDNIQEKDKDATMINEFPDLPHLVGSGQSVGGVVSETVGVSGDSYRGGRSPIQLQRIVSRCKCEFFYVSYGDTSIDPGTISEVSPPPVEESMSPWENQDEPVDAFTLMHHDLDVCTNSLQYAMILDIVNNLLLYVEPQRKEALERLARMRFQLQLYSGEDQKRPIQHIQTEILGLLSRIRCLEKDIHFITKARLEEGDSDELRSDYDDVQKSIRECKEKLSNKSDELDMMLSCYNETQLSASNRLATIRKDKPLTIVRANEICFKHAQWRLTEADGQIGIADLILSNFLYTKNSKSDDSVDHLLELGYIRINNLIPRDNYKEVLCPTEIQRDMPVDHKRVLRVFCREKPPVGGISVKEHFEINVVPITIAISKKFYNTMLKFCFPDRDALEVEGNDELEDGASSSTTTKSSSKKTTSSKGKKSSKDSNFYVKIQDDVEKMKERAEKNKLFIYIKIPEVPVRVSYKGNKEKNIEDITDLSLLIPTLEYHNVTWTWLDLLLAMKSDSRKVLLSQAIKQKLKLKKVLVDEQPSPQEEDKAKMLFGNRHAPENKSLRRGVFKFSKS
ncbi:protein hobbit [Sabethes cyaneus]|uniref:protein hobbit n=1 Tax=Sabethes cyaneus TaxID=53552 RepID=UPI00237DFF4B|nr:protein hobbit [Sabethes cyaneus]